MPRATNPIAVTIDEGSPSQPISISGTLVHGLPGTLRDVRVLHIWPKRNPLQTMGAAESDRIAVRRFSAQMPNRREIRSVTPWVLGEPLDQRGDALGGEPPQILGLATDALRVHGRHHLGGPAVR